MDWKRIAPWNWFRREQEVEGGAALAPGAPEAGVSLRREMERAFDDVFRRFALGSPPEPPWAGGVSVLRPSVDISEGRKAYTVEVEVPGVEEGDISLEVEQDTLRIRGEKKHEREESDEGYHCIERSFGAFERLLSLPEDADAQGVGAKFKNGVLKITIPKRPAPERAGRRIEIHRE